MKIVGAIFEKMKILIFFLMWTTLNFEGRSKTKKVAGDICKRTLDIECERDWSVSLGAMLGDGQKIKNYISSFRDLFGKSRWCHTAGLRMYYKPTKFNQNRLTIFEKIKIFNFFLMWTTLNFRGRGKNKKRLEIFARGP